MAIVEILLEKVQDNPYNPRKYYAPAKVKEMADSLVQNGILEVPEGRYVGKGGEVQLAFGGVRRRGFLRNKEHKQPGRSWLTMPVDVKDISDEEMFHKAIEENLRRTDNKPIEIARCINGFKVLHPEMKDEDVAKKHGMTPANVSNMQRVLKLPEKFLEKIDEGKISFTQGRELLTLEGIPDAEHVMSAAINGLNTGTKQYGEPNTVEGLQKSIFNEVKGRFPSLEKENNTYRYELLFDTRAAGCLKCDKCLSTHSTKTQVAHFCVNEKCWKEKTEAHKRQAAKAAKKKMEDEVIALASKDIAAEPPKKQVPVPPIQPVKEAAAEKLKAPGANDAKVPFTIEPLGSSFVAFDSTGAIIAIEKKRDEAEASAREYLKPIKTQLNPDTFMLNHTYRLIPKDLKADFSSDVTAQDLPTALKALKIKPDAVRDAKVWKASGNIGTGGAAACGWSKCEEPMEVQTPPEAKTVEPAKPLTETKTKDKAGKVESPAIPEDAMAKARKAAGTRAEVLDLNDIATGDQYYRQAKQGYAILDAKTLSLIDNSGECLRTCTHGFHYAFDSKGKSEKEFKVCSDSKCLSKKKGDLTRKKNARGMALKKAEQKAIQTVTAMIGGADIFNLERKSNNHTIVRPFLDLLIYGYIHRKEANYYGAETVKTAEKWLWDKLSSGTAAAKRTNPELWKLIAKLSDADLVKTLIELNFYYLQYHEEINDYEIHTVDALALFNVKVEPPVGIKLKTGTAGQVIDDEDVED